MFLHNQCPCTRTYGGSSPAAIRKAGQYTAWNLIPHDTIKGEVVQCMYKGQKVKLFCFHKLRDDFFSNDICSWPNVIFCRKTSNCYVIRHCVHPYVNLQRKISWNFFPFIQISLKFNRPYGVCVISWNRNSPRLFRPQTRNRQIFELCRNKLFDGMLIFLWANHWKFNQ